MARRVPKPGATVPNPGSPEAKRRGCLCPRLDNNNGEGFPVDGQPCWWMTDDCPLHGARVRAATTFVTNGQRQNVNTP